VAELHINKPLGRLVLAVVALAQKGRRQQRLEAGQQTLAVVVAAGLEQVPLAQAAPALSSWNTKHHHKPYSPSKGLVSGLCLLVLRQLITWSLLAEVVVAIKMVAVAVAAGIERQQVILPELLLVMF
jgi:hypothetical protein